MADSTHELAENEVIDAYESRRFGFLSLYQESRAIFYADFHVAIRIAKLLYCPSTDHLVNVTAIQSYIASG
jgi:hypothetical protein